MRNLRPLLRLDDKVAAEWRRLEQIGGQPMGWIAPLALAVAALLHGAIMLLPVAHGTSSAAATSQPTDFPLVWRPPIPPAPRVVPVLPPRPVPPPPVVPETSIGRSRDDDTARDLLIEPVPEPAPELALASISAEIEAIIPSPDAPPPMPEIGPPQGAAADASLSLIEKVEPVYPLAARSILAEARVTVRLFVLPDGSVGRAIVEECSRPGLGFESAALDAVKRWRYEPAPLQTGARKVTVTIHFQRQDGRK